MLQYTSQVFEIDIYITVNISSCCKSVNTGFTNYSPYITLSMVCPFPSVEPYTSNYSCHSVFYICKYSQLKLSSVHIFMLQYTSQVVEKIFVLCYTSQVVVSPSIRHLTIILCIFLSVLLVSSPIRNSIHRVILATLYSTFVSILS